MHDHRLTNPYAVAGPPSGRAPGRRRRLRATMVGVSAVGGLLGMSSPAFAGDGTGPDVARELPSDHAGEVCTESVPEHCYPAEQYDEPELGDQPRPAWYADEDSPGDEEVESPPTASRPDDPTDQPDPQDQASPADLADDLPSFPGPDDQGAPGDPGRDDREAGPVFVWSPTVVRDPDTGLLTVNFDDPAYPVGEVPADLEYTVCGGPPGAGCYSSPAQVAKDERQRKCLDDFYTDLYSRPGAPDPTVPRPDDAPPPPPPTNC